MKTDACSAAIEQRELTPEERDALLFVGQDRIDVDRRLEGQEAQLAAIYQEYREQENADVLVRPKSFDVITEDDLDFVPVDSLNDEDIPITPVIPTPIRRKHDGFDYTPRSGNNWYNKLRPNEPADLVDGANGLIRKSCGVLNYSQAVIPSDNAIAGASKAVRSNAAQPVVFTGEYTWKLDADYQFNLFTDRDIGSSVNGNIRIGVHFFDRLGPPTRPFRLIGALPFKTITYSVGGGSLPTKYPGQRNLAHYGRERATGKTTSSFSFRMKPNMDYYVMFHFHAQVAAHNAAIWWRGSFELD